MIEAFKISLWKNFGAAIDMLSNAIKMHPQDKWQSNKIFFYNAYHCAVFLDYYLSIPPRNFFSPLPYTLVDMDKIPPGAIDDVVPDIVYSKKELLAYIADSRSKCRKVIAGLTEENITASWLTQSGDENLDLASNSSRNCSVMEILFYNLRHVQHHTAQLNLLLRQTINNAPDYVSMAEDDLNF